MPARPNILLVFSDQESHHDLLPGVAAPHQARLAARGASFVQPYCTTPQCSPARASLLTGLYPHQSGVQTNLEATGARELAPGTPTLGTLARAAGYRTAYFGKWHLSSGRGAEAFGFDLASHPGGHGAADPGVAAQAADWLRAQRDGPWLAVVSLGNPHDIYGFPARPAPPARDGVAAPPHWADGLAGKPPAQARFLHEDQGRPLAGAGAERWRQYRSMYYELIAAADACLGRLLDVLDERELWPQTCVVYTSDHGDLAGAHGLPFKGPCMYEELVRIPLLLAWEGRIPPGAAPAGLASHLDLVPTLCAAAGLPVPPGCPGLDLLELAAGRRQRREVFFEYLAKQRWVCPIRALRTGPWKLSRYLDDGALELYHLGADPHESTNLAASPEHAGTLAELAGRLERWRRQSGDRLPGSGAPR